MGRVVFEWIIKSGAGAFVGFAETGAPLMASDDLEAKRYRNWEELEADLNAVEGAGFEAIPVLLRTVKFGEGV